jgi:hypothetical protein
MNFADESACLTIDDIWNEVVTIHRSQDVLKILLPLHIDIFRSCFVKKHRYNNPSCTYSTPDTSFNVMVSAFVLPFLHWTLTLQSLEL